MSYKIAPYCNSCLSQDVEVVDEMVYCVSCGNEFPLQEIAE